MYKARAYAKANLSLNIAGRRGDFHTLDMLTTSIDLYDELTLNFREDHKVTFSIEANGLKSFSPKLFTESVKRVLPKVNEAYHFTGVDVKLIKNIPSGGGFGGSSACGAAAAKIIAKANGAEPSKDFLLSLGSDIPFVYSGGVQRVQGIGEILTPVSIPELLLLIVKPKQGVFSRECFKTYDKIGTKGEADIDNLIKALQSGDLKSANDYAYNQLSESAEKIQPNIFKIKKQLRALGADFVVMTGSGSGVCAILSSREQGEEMRSKLAKKWWCKIVKTLPYGVEIIE
ncbi:MAG: hypothetical protein PHE93_03235 [Clostridia bacterium]|nr:hypothetical protein [Clostridia bacterium]